MASSLTIRTMKRKYAAERAFATDLLYVCFFALLTLLVLYKTVSVADTSLHSSFWTIYGLIATVFLISRLPYAYLYNDDHDEVYAYVSYPSVSVIIAAKNEEEGIFETIRTCMVSKYPGEIECLVINDGSTDKTGDKVRKAVALYGEKVKLIEFEENKGKREAMAAGITQSKNEIIVFVDSDSFLSRDAIKRVVQHFLANPQVGAVSGNTKVENNTANVLTRIQSIQYAISYDIYKASESVHKTVTCCPGCFSAYRREAIGGLVEAWKTQHFFGSKGTFGDDRALTNFVLKKWKIEYCESARASTNVPERFSVYWRQQLRWKKSWIREGVFGSAFMWRKHPLASLGFYINFSFPFMGPVLAGNVLWRSITAHNPLIFLTFISGFILLGLVYSLFVHLHRKAKHWMYIPLFSSLFVFVFMWQMPYAFLTLRKTHWGTR